MVTANKQITVMAGAKIFGLSNFFKSNQQNHLNPSSNPNSKYIKEPTKNNRVL